MNIYTYHGPRAYSIGVQMEIMPEVRWVANGHDFLLIMLAMLPQEK